MMDRLSLKRRLTSEGLINQDQIKYARSEDKCTPLKAPPLEVRWNMISVTAETLSFKPTIQFTLNFKSREAKVDLLDFLISMK